MLEMINVSCCLNQKKILQEVSFDLPEGSFVGVVGPNGAGKTTLLRLISGLIVPSRGKVLIEGKDARDLDRCRISQKLAMVPQNTYISFPYTAFEVVLMGRHPYLGRFGRETKKDLHKVEECMRLTKTWHLKYKKMSQVSGGEIQRIIIAQALAQDTPVLLLDEPTSHLDINNELEILEIISRLNEKKGKSVILVSHNLNLAARYCKKLILLKEGRVFARGEVEEVLTPENIRSVYHLNALVKKHPLTGYIYTLPISLRGKEESKREKGKIHLIGGGGSASRLMKKLAGLGYDVSLGVVNVFDADYETAQTFGISCVAEAPFSPVTDESYRRNKELIGKSNLVVLCGSPFGSGNILNLRAALWALRSRKVKVIVQNHIPIDKRDYTGGEAARIFQTLVNQGAVVIKEEDEIVDFVRHHLCL